MHGRKIQTATTLTAHFPWGNGVGEDWEQSQTPFNTSLPLVKAQGGQSGHVDSHGHLPARGCATQGAGTALTLHVTHAVLADHPSVILLVCRPLVDEHSGVGGPGVQHDAILQVERQESGPEGGSPSGCPGRLQGSYCS